MRRAICSSCRMGFGPCNCVRLWIIWWTVECYGAFWGERYYVGAN